MATPAIETRSIALETEIDTTPVQLWRALTESEELTRWFPLEARVTPGIGGSIWISWGHPVVAESTIAVWDPERHLKTVESRPIGILLQPKNQPATRRSVDYWIEPSGKLTRLKLVHDGFGVGASWDQVYSGVLRGWEFQLRSLRHYLERHHGQDRRVAWVKRTVNQGFTQVWESLMGANGKLGAGQLSASEGKPYILTPGADDVLRGTVEIFDRPRQFTATVENWNDALFRMYLVDHPGGGGLDVSVWLAAYNVPEERINVFQERWKDLIATL
jgi:hypothetical protein